MRPEIVKQQQIIFAQPSNARFLRPTPRTLREAGLTPFDEKLERFNYRLDDVLFGVAIGFFVTFVVWGLR